MKNHQNRESDHPTKHCPDTEAVSVFSGPPSHGGGSRWSSGQKGTIPAGSLGHTDGGGWGGGHADTCRLFRIFCSFYLNRSKT